MLAVDVLYGIAIAIGLSVLNLLRRIVRPHDAILGFVPGVAGMHDIEDYPDATQVPGLMVYRYDAPLFFADADNFRTRALRSIDEAEEPVRWFVLNAEANTEIDFTAADILEELRAELADRGITLGLARVKFEVRAGPEEGRADRRHRTRARVRHPADGGRGLPHLGGETRTRHLSTSIRWVQTRARREIHASSSRPQPRRRAEVWSYAAEISHVSAVITSSGNTMVTKRMRAKVVTEAMAFCCRRPEESTPVNCTTPASCSRL